MNERTEPIRVTIVEDHADFRDGLRLMLTSSGKFTVVGAFHSVESALRDLPECDVLLLDINLPGKSGTESLPMFKRAAPATQIVMMTGLDDDDSIFNAILAGADGYLLKKTAPAKVLTAVEDAAAGGTPMTPFVARRVIEHFKQSVPVQRDYQLSEREMQILSYLVQGMDNRQIAELLFISYETVRNHVKHIYEKLHVNSRAQAVSKALTEHLVK